MDEKRLLIALFGLVVALVVGFIGYQFIAPLTVAVFLYYSTRRLFHRLERFRLPARVRAVVSLSLVGIPLISLLGYTVLLVLIEARRFIDRYPLAETIGDNTEWIGDLAELSNPSLDEFVAAYRSGQLDPFIEFISDQAGLLASTLSGLVLNLLIVLVVTYYLLLDGSKLHEWLLTLDDDTVIREYLETADAELEAVLYGNLLNVIAISIIAVITYTAYNVVAPPSVEIPYPALAGALTGIASLIPVIGMKIVYVPLAVVTSIPTVLGDDLALLAYVAGFLVVVAVVVDTIPDILLRPYFSGKTTHVGLLMLAYIFGPVVFGFHGLFLAPIVLVLALTFADTALLRLLGRDPDETGAERGAASVPSGQRRLDEF
ncbi:MAG: AI-2E family transporter [Halorubrum sp.]